MDERLTGAARGGRRHEGRALAMGSVRWNSVAAVERSRVAIARNVDVGLEGDRGTPEMVPVAAPVLERGSQRGGKYKVSDPRSHMWNQRKSADHSK